MNWDELQSNATRDGYRIADVRAHWSRLGQFRRAHVSVGAGTHAKIADAPYTFSRSYDGNGIADKVVVALDVPVGKPVAIKVGGIFANGSKVRDAYAGTTYTVANGAVRTGGKFSTVLLEPAR
jgi:alpha-amylase